MPNKCFVNTQFEHNKDIFQVLRVSRKFQILNKKTQNILFIYSIILDDLDILSRSTGVGRLASAGIRDPTKLDGVNNQHIKYKLKTFPVYCLHSMNISYNNNIKQHEMWEDNQDFNYYIFPKKHQSIWGQLISHFHTVFQKYTNKHIISSIRPYPIKYLKSPYNRYPWIKCIWKQATNIHKLINMKHI